MLSLKLYAVRVYEFRVNKLPVLATQCPKIYRKSVLHLVKNTANL